MRAFRDHRDPREDCANDRQQAGPRGAKSAHHDAHPFDRNSPSVEQPNASAHPGHGSHVARWIAGHSNEVPNCADGHPGDLKDPSEGLNCVADHCSSASRARDHHDHLCAEPRNVGDHHARVSPADPNSSIAGHSNEDGHPGDHHARDFRCDRSSSSEDLMYVAARRDQHRNGVHLNARDHHARDHHDGRRNLREVKNSADDHFRVGLSQEVDPCRADPGLLLGVGYSNEDDQRNRLACHGLKHWNHVSPQRAYHRNDRLLLEVCPNRIDHCRCLKAAVTGLHLGRCALP